jgi:two-component system response regulator RegA
LKPDPRDYQPLGLHAQRRLLIVENDEPHRRALMLFFERRGYELKAASCAPEASTLLDEWRPDYAIIDVCLPGPAGLTLIPRVKFVSPDARVVMVSGYASIAAAVQSIKLGATQYLMKPVDAQTIEAAFCNLRADITARPGDNLPSVERVAWEYMQRVLMANNGNVSATARALHMHRKTLQRKLGRHPVSQ